MDDLTSFDKAVNAFFARDQLGNDIRRFLANDQNWAFDRSISEFFNDAALDQSIAEFFGDAEFKPSEHPRGGDPENPGRFSKVAGRPTPITEGRTEAFASPSVATSLAFSRAKTEVSGRRQRAFADLSKTIDSRLNITSDMTNTIGAWSDGAENSMLVTSAGDPAKARAALILKGAVANQKAVLVFTPHPGGDQVFTTFEVKAGKGGLEEIHRKLLDGGLANHTLEPTSTGAKVHVYADDIDENGNSPILDAVTAFTQAEKIEYQATEGTGELIGTNKQDGTDEEQRAGAQRQYERAISEMEATGQCPDCNLREIWQDARDRWDTENSQANLERDLSVRDILSGDFPAERPRSRRVPAIARDLMARGIDALKALGVESGRIEGPNPDTDQLLARVISSEVKDALQKAGHAGDWYTKRVAQAMSVAAEMYPELATDRHARTAYTGALAITSQGEVVPSNVRLADQAYRQYRETGHFPTDVRSKTQDEMNANFDKLNSLLDSGGPAGMTDFLHQDFTVRELESLGYEVGGELKDTKVKGSAILGPKIGQGFFQNLNGNYNPVTMDLWFMRGWGRLTGTLQGQLDPKALAKTRTRFEKALTKEGETPPADLAKLRDRAEAIGRQHERDFAKYRAEFDAGIRKKSELVRSAERLVHAIDGVNEEPSSGGQRNWIRSVIDRTREELKQAGTDLTNADLQALWWYPEKDLYAKLGSRESRTINVDYATALGELARKHGIAEAAVTRALGAVDRRPGRTAAKDDQGRIEGIRQKGNGIIEKEKTADLDQAINAFFGNGTGWDSPLWASDTEFKEEQHPRKKTGEFTLSRRPAAAG